MELQQLSDISVKSAASRDVDLKQRLCVAHRYCVRAATLRALGRLEVGKVGTKPSRWFNRVFKILMLKVETLFEMLSCAAAARQEAEADFCTALEDLGDEDPLVPWVLSQVDEVRTAQR